VTEGRRRYSDAVPEDVEARVRAVCMALPDAYEERAWAGTRWMVRKRTFAQVIGVENPAADLIIVLVFRSEGTELEMLRHAGHPFFTVGWGRDAMGMVLDDETDWDEVSELVRESYCIRAPKKLRALIDSPDADGRAGRPSE
jgi:hypothetical protein